MITSEHKAACMSGPSVPQCMTRAETVHTARFALSQVTVSGLVA